MRKNINKWSDKYGKQKHDKRIPWQNVSSETKNRSAPLQNTQDKVWDKEVKNYIEKVALEHSYQMPVYSKQIIDQTPS